MFWPVYISRRPWTEDRPGYYSQKSCMNASKSFYETHEVPLWRNDLNPWIDYPQIIFHVIPIFLAEVTPCGTAEKMSPPPPPLHFVISCWQLIRQQITVLSCLWQAVTHLDSCRAAHYDWGELGLTATEMENISLTDSSACSWAADASEQSNFTLRSDILSFTFSQQHQSDGRLPGLFLSEASSPLRQKSAFDSTASADFHYHPLFDVVLVPALWPLLFFSFRQKSCITTHWNPRPSHMAQLSFYTVGYHILILHIWKGNIKSKPHQLLVLSTD